jgi:hypothetical protein
MTRVQQIIEKETGEVLSQRDIKGNIDFVMVFRQSMPATRDLAIKEPKAFALLWFLIEQMDRENALIISKETLAELHDCSIRTITRQLAVLKDSNFITIVKSGVSNVYLVNASVAWTADGNKKQYAKFKAQVVVSKSEQAELKTKMNRIKQLSLLDS